MTYKLGSWYNSVKYAVSVRDSEGTLAYFTTWEDFNKANVGDKIRYNICRFKVTSIEIVKVLG